MAIETIPYIGLPNCRRISNGAAEIIVTTDVGPRIIRYALTGGENILGELPEPFPVADPGSWKPWGGHRLWTAPEERPRTYAPDNDVVEVEILGQHALRLLRRADAWGIEKEMTVTLDAEGSGVTIDHRVTNRSAWPVQLAPWGLTIMNGGGTAIMPQEPYRPHNEYLLPARSIALWHYTDLTDPRWNIGSRHIHLRTDAGLHAPQKIGLMNKQGWVAYRRGDLLFTKRFPFIEGALYPDYGCNTEVYTAGNFIELESLAPLETLAPGASALHREQWKLERGKAES